MRTVLYCQGTFDIPHPDSTQKQAMMAAAIDIASAGFSCVILGQWHVHADGSIYYNDTVVADVEPTLAWLPGVFKQAGVEQVLVSFGAARHGSMS